MDDSYFLGGGGLDGLGGAGFAGVLEGSGDRLEDWDLVSLEVKLGLFAEPFVEDKELENGRGGTGRGGGGRDKWGDDVLATTLSAVASAMSVLSSAGWV